MSMRNFSARTSWRSMSLCREQYQVRQWTLWRDAVPSITTSGYRSYWCVRRCSASVT